jgi:hypothetical protein
MRLGRQGRFKYEANLEIVYVYPNLSCNETFIGYFTVGQHAFSLTSTRPVEIESPTFEPSIVEISPAFCTIYTEAYKAEQLGLLEICGVGYRKSVEFLVKDYIIRARPGNKMAVEAIMLGPCIENYVYVPRIKEVAKRVTWLGNDETHYRRRWIDKDLSDLRGFSDWGL